jgi:hypothetical protein
MPVNREILSRLLATLPQPAPCLKELHVFQQWVIVHCDRYAMATFLPVNEAGKACDLDTYLGDKIGRPVPEILESFADSDDALRLAFAIACLKASLPLPDNLFDGNAAEPFAEMVKHRPSCFIGHFTQGERWRALGYPVTLVELQPMAGDVHWNDSTPALRDAEIVFITGLTLGNGTFLEVVERTPRGQYRVLMGRSVPCSPVFFEYGIHLIGATLIANAELALRYCQHGGTSVRKTPPGALRQVNLTNRPELIIPRKGEVK